MDLRKLSKKGRREIREEREQRAKLDKTIVGIARLKAEYGIVWKYVQERDLWESDYWKRFVGLHEKTLRMLENRFVQFGGRAYPVEIRGDAGLNVSHESLDQAVKEEFGDEVYCHSEAEELFIDCTQEVATDVLGFIEHRDPIGDYDCNQWDAEGTYSPELRMDLPFGLLDGDAQRWLNARGETVNVDFEGAPGPSEAQIKRATDYIRQGFQMLHPELAEDEIDELVEDARDAAARLAQDSHS